MLKLFFRSTRSYFLKMSLKNIENNSEIIKNTLRGLKNDLKILKDQYNAILIRELCGENTRLAVSVDEAKKKLIQLETQNGIKQIPIPVRGMSKTPVEPALEIMKKDHIEKNEKKVKEPKAKKPTKESKTDQIEPPVDIGRLDLRIGHVVHVEKHPEADSLYLLKVDCGEEKPRTVCSGLVKHVPIENLQNVHVVLLCNLKPVKMRGIMSEAMVMCASCENGVEVLQPPSGCTAGELVECSGYIRNPDSVMNPKKKIFETVAPDLHTNDSCLACYKGVALTVPGKGEIKAITLKNVPIK